MATNEHLPAEAFAHEVLSVLAQGDITLAAFADSIDVTPAWLERVLTGQIAELPLLTVLGICRRLRIVPDDIWEAEIVARAFSDFPGSSFVDDED